MISREKKKEIIQDLADKISRQKVIIFSDYTGLTVNQVQELRSKLRDKGIDYRVAKKTLIDLVLKQAGVEGVKVKEMTGQISVAFGYGDEIEPAKIINDFSKEKESLKIVAGLVNGQLLSAESVLDLAKLPSRPELLAKVIGSIAAPASGLVGVLKGNLRSLVYILSNIKSEA